MENSNSEIVIYLSNTKMAKPRGWRYPVPASFDRKEVVQVPRTLS